MPTMDGDSPPKEANLGEWSFTAAGSSSFSCCGTFSSTYPSFDGTDQLSIPLVRYDSSGLFIKRCIIAEKFNK